MDKSKIIAGVTGASGMIGRRIVDRLLTDGYRVRVLSRKEYFEDPRANLFKGGLEDEEILRSFLFDTDLLFHCAANLSDEPRMWRDNVLGTERLMKAIEKSKIKYLCHISSAGVIGKTKNKWVDETTKCDPQNVYEKTKWEAEKIVAKGIEGCKIVILRPTNVINADRPGALALPIEGSWMNKLKVFIKGGECAHIIHAEDVAEAAMFFISRPINSPQCYFVSCDHEPLNTFAGLWAFCKGIKNNKPINEVKPVTHLPLIIPFLLRKLVHGQSNRGDVRYSSEKLISAGFNFNLGLKGAVQQVISMQ